MDFLDYLLTRLRATIAAKAAPLRGALCALLNLAWNRISRAQYRLDKLIAKWRAGTLPKPRPSRAGQPRKPAATTTERPKFPYRRGWLLEFAGEIPYLGEELQRQMESQPEFAEFIAACPQAGRILRPLCHMLGIEVPATFRREPPKRKPRPRAEPRPPKPPKPEFPHPNRDLPARFRIRVPGLRWSSA